MNTRTYFTPANGYNPRYGVRQTKNAVNSVKYSVENVWGAAVAAQRVNGEYVKEDQYLHDLITSERILTKKRNRDIMMDFLCVPGTITDEDRTAGNECRKFLQNDLTFRALKGQLNDFDQSVSRVVAVDEFDSLQNRLELAVVACLPQSHQRSLARQEIDSRVRQTTGEYVGAVNDKISLDVEVVSANYSKNYGIFWVTAITKNNQAVFFSNKEKFDTGTWVTIRGTVKAHCDGKTQLNRVKVL